MFIVGNEWVPQVWEAIPRDVQVGIAAQAVIPLFQRSEWIYPNWETIVVHPGSFMSPSYPFAHYSETFELETCVLFSAEHVLAPIMLANGAPLIGLYEYKKVARLSLGIEANRTLTALPDDQIKAIFVKATGVPDIDMAAATLAQ